MGRDAKLQVGYMSYLTRYLLLRREGLCGDGNETKDLTFQQHFDTTKTVYLLLFIKSKNVFN